MDIELRLAALSKLVATDSDAVARRLEAEFKRQETLLLESSEHEELSGALKTLAVLAPRFHMALLPILETFVRSAPARTLTYGGAAIDPSMARYLSADALTSLAVDAAKQIQYVHTEHVLDFLLELSRSGSDQVRRKASQSLEDLAKFDISIFHDRHQGATPQARIVTHLTGMKDDDLEANTDAILRVIGEVLSPSMEGHSWTYSSVTIQRGSIVSDGGVSEMREQAIALLKRMYSLDTDVDFRKKVLRTMDVATRRERPADDSETSRMLERDTIAVLEFRRSLVSTNALPLVQTIEHQTYWDYYHAATVEIEKKALQVRDELAAHSEYQIYKQLIGFEGIFGAWEELRRSEAAWDYSDAKRREAASKYLQEIDDTSFNLWRDRILEFSKTQSRDLAAFPVYYEFLESIGRDKPRLALELVTAQTDAMSSFLIPLLRGLWESSHAPDIEKVIDRWIADGSNLTAIAKSLYRIGAPRLATLDAVITRSSELDQRDAMLEAAGVAASLYADGCLGAKALFMRALRSLAKRGDSRWANAVWFSRDIYPLINSMSQGERAEVLASLVSTPKLDYQTEEVLSAIAELDVQSVLDYLVERLKLAVERSDSDEDDLIVDERFEAVPYQFYKLDKEFSKVPELVLAAARRTFDEESSALFTYRGARLIEATFSDFGEPLEGLLLKTLESQNEEDIEFVVSVLRAYDGSMETLEVCKAIIKAVPERSEHWNELAAVIESTGVVAGEYGLVDAYEARRAQMSSWLGDDNARVREFAKWLSEGLERIIESEKTRADEGIALRKYKYGLGNDES